MKNWESHCRKHPSRRRITSPTGGRATRYSSPARSPRPRKPLARGKVGVDLSIEEGYAAARLCGLNILAQLHAAVGDDIDRAKAIKLGGFVNAPADFTGPPAIINGTSDLMVEVFGEEAGKHARFAVAVASLPGGAAVEVDAIFEIE